MTTYASKGLLTPPVELLHITLLTCQVLKYIALTMPSNGGDHHSCAQVESYDTINNVVKLLYVEYNLLSAYTNQ